MNTLKEADYPTFLLNYLFVVGIVNSKINGTMAWLSYKSQTEQDTVIAFSIRQAQRAKLLCKQHKSHIANIQQKRHVENKPKERCKF